MMEHELKTDPGVFEDIVSGHKRFEIRFNDRDFKALDVLKLRKTKHTAEEMRKGKPLEFIGPPLFVNVLYIIYGPIYGLKDGWVAMTIEPRDGCNA